MRDERRGQYEPWGPVRGAAIEVAADRRRLRGAALFAVAFHVALLAVVWPESPGVIEVEAPERDLFVLADPPRTRPRVPPVEAIETQVPRRILTIPGPPTERPDPSSADDRRSCRRKRRS